MNDFQGTPIEVGAAVCSTSYGYGTPQGANHGIVVGFGRTKVQIHWDGYSYDPAYPHHSSRPSQLRVLKES